MTVLSEQEFRVKSDEALESARRALLPLADSDGFEVELQNGVLNLVFEEPTEMKFVVSPNAPVRQVWVSASSAIASMTAITAAVPVPHGDRSTSASAKIVTLRRSARSSSGGPVKIVP